MESTSKKDYKEDIWDKSDAEGSHRASEFIRTSEHPEMSSKEAHQKQERGYNNNDAYYTKVKPQNNNSRQGLALKVDAPSHGERTRGIIEDSEKQAKSSLKQGQDNFFSSKNQGYKGGNNDFNFGDCPTYQSS